MITKAWKDMTEQEKAPYNAQAYSSYIDSIEEGEEADLTLPDVSLEIEKSRSFFFFLSLVDRVAHLLAIQHFHVFRTYTPTYRGRRRSISRSGCPILRPANNWNGGKGGLLGGEKKTHLSIASFLTLTPPYLCRVFIQANIPCRQAAVGNRVSNYV
jgi:hypothetical protein